ncbi:DNA repair protein recO [Spiroplasma syrphidicola EA-1]|uniref:DNA repair protein RecO n=1 Tax=Spiroplasma syrphidicola EA-1 TaxID=1276229 RepID=R4UIE8_9MOLU|nr:DNA repair protein RecO [Spiroplasma syrphidicola]AGM25940.1 DNA repair protein recO [Spiroplasma syrphidicola EA-1]
MANTLQGLVISKINYNDYDQIITIFSREEGKLSFYAPGVRKAISKNQFSLQLFATSEFELFLSYHKNKVSKLKTGVLIKDRNLLAKDYDDYLVATLMVEVLDQVIEERTGDDELYNLITNSLDRLLNNSDNLIIVIFYLFKMLKWYGLRWDFSKCQRCHKKEGIKTISFIDQGLLCRGCITEKDYLFSIGLIKEIILWQDHQFTVTAFDNKTFVTNQELMLLFKMLCEYYLNVVGIFSYSIKEMADKSIYFK